jgi:hypothetical protein
MKRKPRQRRPIEKGKPKGYDSKWEKTLHDTVLQDWVHHDGKVPYVIEHNYHPDFTKRIGRKKIIIEAKGRFWDYAEFTKYIWIQKALPSSTELVFLFANSSAPMPQAKRRKDGTKRSHGEWASDNGFRWFTVDTLPEEWRSESETKD